MDVYATTGSPAEPAARSDFGLVPFCAPYGEYEPAKRAAQEAPEIRAAESGMALLAEYIANFLLIALLLIGAAALLADPSGERVEQGVHHLVAHFPIDALSGLLSKL